MKKVNISCEIPPKSIIQTYCLLLGKQYSAYKLKYLHYIPNMAEQCLMEPEDFPYRACLLNLNTGQMYQLGIYEDGIEETGIQITTGLNSGRGSSKDL